MNSSILFVLVAAFLVAVASADKCTTGAVAFRSSACGAAMYTASPGARFRETGYWYTYYPCYAGNARWLELVDTAGTKGYIEETALSVCNGGAGIRLQCLNAPQFVGQTTGSGGNRGQCTGLVESCANQPNANAWIKGPGGNPAVFEKGDVIATFFGWSGPNTYGGHTAVFDSWDGTCMNVYQQNWNGLQYVTYSQICTYYSCSTCNPYDYFRVMV